MYLDNPMLPVAYEAAKTAHYGGHPLGNSILGTVESITALEADQMREYFARRYSPSNIVLAFAGKAEWGSLVDLAKTHCGGWLGGTATRESVPHHGTGSFRAILRADDQQQTVVAVCDGPPLESPDRYAAHLLATILGDHTGSRLYWTLIDPGLADGAELSYQDYNQAGAFFTFLSCEPDSTQANLGRIAELYKTAMAQGLTDQELTQAKNKVLARSVLRSERPMGRLASLGFHWMYRHVYITVEEELRGLQFNRVTLDDMRAGRCSNGPALAADGRLGRPDHGSASGELTAPLLALSVPRLSPLRPLPRGSLIEMRYVSHLSCTVCGAEYPAGRVMNLCERDGRPLQIVLDLERLKAERGRDGWWSPSRRDLWRFGGLLPLDVDDLDDRRDVITRGEGFTPCRSYAHPLAGRLRCRLEVKDEGKHYAGFGGNPTLSFKDRGMAMTVSLARSLGLTRLAVPTQGNAGDSLAEYAVASEIEAVIVMSPDTDLRVLGRVAALARLYPEWVKLDVVAGTIIDCGSAAFAKNTFRAATSTSRLSRSPGGAPRGRRRWDSRWPNRPANAWRNGAGNSPM